MHPVFDNIFDSFVPYLEAEKCAGCSKEIEERKILWDEDGPFCSLECAAEYKQTWMEGLYDDM